MEGNDLISSTVEVGRSRSGLEESRKGVGLAWENQLGEYKAKKEPWARRQVCGSCPGLAIDLLCELGQIPVLWASDFPSIKWWNWTAGSHEERRRLKSRGT